MRILAHSQQSSFAVYVSDAIIGLDREEHMKSANLSQQSELKKRYLQKAIEEYEYSFAAEYDKAQLSPRAVSEGTVDFDYDNADADVDISSDGAWVNARVWIPQKWLQNVE